MSMSRRGFMAAAGIATTALAIETNPRRATGIEQPPIPTSDEIGQSGPKQHRALSLPGSRICVNPYKGKVGQTPLAWSIGPQLPLHASYWAADDVDDMMELLSIYRVIPDAVGEVTEDWRDDFDTVDPAWTPSAGLDVSVDAGVLRLVNTDTAPDWFGTFSRPVTADVDATPYLQISVLSLADAWGLVVVDSTGKQIVVQADSNLTGVFTYDLRQITGWSGQQSFDVMIRVAIQEMPATFDFVRIAGVTTVVEQASSYGTQFLPYALPTQASYQSGSTIDYFDLLYDVDTLARRATISAGTWRIAGRFRGSVTFDAEQQAVVVSTANYSYAVATSLPSASEVSVYPTLLELLSHTDPGGADLEIGYWAMDIDVAAGDVVFGAGFATAHEGGAAVAARRARVAADGDVRIDRNKALWDDLLRRVPHPQSFVLHGVDPKDATPESVRRMYYHAWVSLAAHVLPPMPEIGFDYPQVATAKPASWGDGPDGAQGTATWDSLFGMQFYAYVDPTLAWSAYRGLMTLVADDGELSGESLPSRKAQTALVLHEVAPNLPALREIYPALRRHLFWAQEHMRWILPGHHDVLAERDAEFVFSLAVDFGYAARIAELVGESGDIEMWTQRRAKIVADSYPWFWSEPAKPTQQYYNLDTGARSAGSTIYTTTGLHVDIIDDAHLAGLIARFRGTYDPSRPFARFGTPKYPDLSYTVYGLLDRGLITEANVLTSLIARDITRSGFFCETYDVNLDPPGAPGEDGLFGIAGMIDSIWMLNGYRMDQGWPHLVRLHADADGGIVNLRLHGRTLEIDLSAGSNRIALSGSFIRDVAGCRRVYVEVGETLPIPRGCATR